MFQRLAYSIVGILVMACGPTAREAAPGADASTDAPADVAPDAPAATVTGKIYAPNQGPGQAAPGQEIPISGALVYVTSDRPAPIPDRVYCDECISTPEGSVRSLADGSFSLSVPPGTYWLVIQKGQFRLEHRVELALGAVALPPSQTTFQALWDPEAGIFMPRIALARGTHDNIEDILGKLGVGTMAGNNFSTPEGERGPEIDLYTYTATGSSVSSLLTDLDRMRRYHVIFFPCATTLGGVDSLLRDQNVLANIRRYVNEGGKLYVTDWTGEVADRAFPSQIELGDAGTDSTGTYDPETFGGTLATVGTANGAEYTVIDGVATDGDLAAWLAAQVGPSATGEVGAYDPQALVVTDLWNWIRSVNPVVRGADSQGEPIFDVPRVWVTGSAPHGAPAAPIAVTYQPTGCGKVLYTSFQTSSSSHVGLRAQERVLLYLIMEIQACSPIL